MTATSTEQSTDSSWAFLNKPPLRLRKVLKAYEVSSLDRKTIGNNFHELAGLLKITFREREASRRSRRISDWDNGIFGHVH